MNRMNRMYLLLLASALVWGCSPRNELELGSIEGLVPLPASVSPMDGMLPVAVRAVDWDMPDGWHDSLVLASQWVFPNGEPNGGKPTPIVLEQQAGWGAEGYELVIADDRVHLVASTAAGAFRGLTTLRQLAPVSCETLSGCPDGFQWPAVHIQDAPVYEHRGLLLDVCRHFMEVDFVKKVLDGLALHKFNVLHWHLTEDQGWRLAMDAYPKLTEVGAWRTEEDGTLHGGFYSKDEIRQVVEYAAQRHIKVIPEIEMPGHSRAALAAYPELSCTGELQEVPNKWGVFKDIYCAGNEGTFVFLETVMTEVLELFPSDFIHIGGDEAPKVRWEACSKCQARIASEGLHDEHELQSYFIGRMGQWLADRGRRLVGWDEILDGGLPEGATVQSWRGLDGARRALAMGHDAILSPTSHCYLDYPLDATDLEEVYGFDPSSVGEGTGKVLGGEVNMWSEHAPQSLVESKVYPRASAFAEVMWTPLEQRDFAQFLSRLDRHYDRLDAMEVDYGLETVPVVMESQIHSTTGTLLATVLPAMRGVSGVAGFVPSGKQRPDSLYQWGDTLVIQGEGEIWTEVEHRYRLLSQPPSFPVAGHVGLTANLTSIAHSINAYYPGGGVRGLNDGLLGSMDFRDGRWQATSGEDMRLDLTFEMPIALDSLSIRTYRYQDAWIFDPARITFMWSENGSDHWQSAEIFPESPLAANEAQEIVRWSSSLPGSKAKGVRVILSNPGKCPDWHAAASEPTWLFADELVIHGSRP